MKNKSIREYAKNKNVFFWEIARALKISEPTMSRKMRDELGEAQKIELYGLIDKISEKKKEGV